MSAFANRFQHSLMNSGIALTLRARRSPRPPSPKVSVRLVSRDRSCVSAAGGNRVILREMYFTFLGRFPVTTAFLSFDLEIDFAMFQG